MQTNIRLLRAFEIEGSLSHEEVIEIVGVGRTAAYIKNLILHGISIETIRDGKKIIKYVYISKCDKIGVSKRGELISCWNNKNNRPYEKLYKSPTFWERIVYRIRKTLGLSCY